MNEIEKFYSDLVSDSSAVTVFELGACDGNHTAMLERIAGDKLALLVSFEAAPYNWDRLPKLSEKVKFFKGAASDRDGFCDLWLSSGPGYHGSSSIREPKKHKEVWPNCKFESRVEVECITLDSAAKRFGVDAIDFIWCDIQGAERDAITGGASILAKTKYFYTEVSEMEHYQGQLLKADFVSHLEAKTGVGWVMEKDFGGDQFGGDVLFRNLKIT